MVCNLSFYSFFRVDDPEGLRCRFLDSFEYCDLRGTLLISDEGINTYLSGPRDQIEQCMQFFYDQGAGRDDEVKLSWSEVHPYRQLKAVVKDEICKLGVADLDVETWRSGYIDPEEMASLAKDPGPVLILDNRNRFEYEMGTFESAQHFGMQSFIEFPQTVAKIQEEFGLDVPVVMFCTGGIRCEKGSAYMRQQGFRNVRQLRGGILGYFEKMGGTAFQGNCFVFDHRGYVSPGLVPYNGTRSEFPAELAEQTKRQG